MDTTHKEINRIGFKLIGYWFIFQTIIFGVVGWLMFIDVTCLGAEFSYVRKGVDYMGQYDYQESIPPVKRK